jgi:hypothetical protein
MSTVTRGFVVVSRASGAVVVSIVSRSFIAFALAHAFALAFTCTFTFSFDTSAFALEALALPFGALGLGTHAFAPSFFAAFAVLVRAVIVTFAPGALGFAPIAFFARAVPN